MKKLLFGNFVDLKYKEKKFVMMTGIEIRTYGVSKVGLKTQYGKLSNNKTGIRPVS